MLVIDFNRIFTIFNGVRFCHFGIPRLPQPGDFSFPAMMQKLAILFAVVLSAHPCRAMEISFAGYDLDNRAWKTGSNPERAPYGGSYGSSGWLFFGQGGAASGFLNSETRIENLPAFVEKVTIHPDGRVAQLESYAEIETPWEGDGQWKSGTLAISTQEAVDAVTLTLGKNPPDAFRIGLLIDNLDAAGCVSAGMTVESKAASAPAAEIMTTGGAGSANMKPDWYFWDVKFAEPGDEIVIRLKPQSGLATLGGIVFASSEDAPKPRHIGEFYREGEYMKDYYVFKEGDTFHLFYNVGDAGKTQDWQEAGNEKAFGHATSKDLKTWEHHPRILEVVPGTWEGQVVSAPSILKYGDTYYMTYTGFDDRVVGKQAIGLATSKDLFNWERYEGNPVYEAPEWTIRNESGWLDCRDAHIIRHGDEFLMFTMVTTDKGKGAIALASSKDLKKWTDLGPAVVTFDAPESPRVFDHNGTFYMFATSGHGKVLLKTKDPKSNKWEEIPFRWPAPGFWSGWEVVQDGDRTIFSAFEWKLDGNFIRFWDVDWNGETPAVRY